MIYLDHASTTSISDKALEVYLNVAKNYFGNSSSLHDEGSSAQQILEASKNTIAQTLNARPKDIYFTSGASESNFLAIYSLLNAVDGKHLITTPIEHSSVRNLFLKLERDGYEVSTVTVDRYGQIDFDELKSLVRGDTALASIQHVNSEIGVVQDLYSISSFLKSKKVLLHSDCVQSYGRIPLNVQDLKLDALSISGHKIYGPKGTGAVWMNPQVPWKPVIPDTDKPNTFKPGTADVPGVAAFATAAKQLNEELSNEQARIDNFRNSLISAIRELPYQVEIIQHPENTIPNILGLQFPGIEGQYFMLECNQAGLAISTGSACQVGTDKPNRTMMAIGKDEQESREFVRLSFGKRNKIDQVPLIIEKIDGILKRHFNKVNHYREKEIK